MAKILIIDDDELVLNALSSLLHHAGHELFITADGPRSIALFKEHSPDVVILDLGLPTTSGMDVLTEIRTINAEAKVIMISGYTAPQVIDEAKHKGAYAFLEKPFEIRTLINLIATLIQPAQN
ncbi:MAG TPA: response regulator [Bacteroidota bacterium]|nr:response regulator [Bacteroidota bacterium]